MNKDLEKALFNKALRIHLIGVGGSGMSGLAALLLAQGHRVTGSDRATTAEIENLKKQGLIFITPHRAEDARESDLVVYSSAIHPGNITFDEANRLGTKMARRAEVLAALVSHKKGIIVCGMHGKTTTSSMAAHVLGEAGLQPSHYVGAPIPILGTNARWNNESDYFVAEGDESDGTLVHYEPEHAIVLNIELEHLDFYKDIEAIDMVYQKLINQTRGHVFYCADDPGATRVCAHHPRAISVGACEGSVYRYTKLTQQKSGSCFEVIARNKKLGSIELKIPGAHNVSNAMLVIALALELGVPLEEIRVALEKFRGARRRFELKYESIPFYSTEAAKGFVAPMLGASRHTLSSCAPSAPCPLSASANVKVGSTQHGILVFDDYGHHPTEIAATLESARSIMPLATTEDSKSGSGRLILMFQPHRYTRTAAFYQEFGRVLLGADLVFVSDIYSAGEQPIEGITAKKIVDASLAEGHSAIYYEPSLEKMRTRVGALLKEGDLLLCLGAGSIYETAEQLVADLKMRDEIVALMTPGRVLLYEPLSLHTTMRVGGPAQFWAEPETEEGFAKLVAFCHERKIPLMVMGRGSNLLVRDSGIPGVVVHLARGVFAEHHVDGMTITAGVGVKLKQLAALARQAGIGSFEWMDGIPGNLGGSLRMNAGAMGQQTFEQVTEIRYLDQEGKIFSCAPRELEIRYRDVPFLKNHYVVSATLKGYPASADEIQCGLQASFTHRKETQPVGASAGCIFKNPLSRSTEAAKDGVAPSLGASRISHTLSSCAPSAPCPSSASASVQADFKNLAIISAGRLIEELGLKNHSVGKARVSEVHGNFIVNDGGATAAEVLQLIDQIKAKALQERGIVLETEVQIVGID